jgi:hypothetical protein
MRKHQSNYQNRFASGSEVNSSVDTSMDSYQYSLNPVDEVLNAAQPEPKKEEDATAPVFLFVASSLNVELVYCILKGITQFGYLTLQGPDEQTVQRKLASMQLQSAEGDRKLSFNKIKIKNSTDWNESSYQDFLHGRTES